MAAAVAAAAAAVAAFAAETVSAASLARWAAQWGEDAAPNSSAGPGQVSGPVCLLQRRFQP